MKRLAVQAPLELLIVVVPHQNLHNFGKRPLRPTDILFLKIDVRRLKHKPRLNSFTFEYGRIINFDTFFNFDRHTNLVSPNFRCHKLQSKAILDIRVGQELIPPQFELILFQCLLLIIKGLIGHAVLNLVNVDLLFDEVLVDNVLVLFGF